MRDLKSLLVATTPLLTTPLLTIAATAATDVATAAESKGTAAGAAGVKDRPNIVCIVSEDNTTEYMSLFCEGRGTKSPAVEALAREGILFENCYSNCPVSSAARSTLISGCYGTRMASHYHRGDMMVDMAEGLRMFPAYMRDAGYYTVNNAKEDYNIVKGKDVWDESSRKGTWRNRAQGQPFYYVHNLADTHEGKMIKSLDKLREEVGDYMPSEGVHLQPNFPDTETFKLCYRFYCKCIEVMDAKVAAVVKELEKDGLMENTIILYYGDNGGIMPNSKGYLTHMGLNVPLVIRVPKRYQGLVDSAAGSRDKRFVSFVDLAPTILSMAGVDVPKGMDGESIWSKVKGDESALQFGYADRMGEKYDMVRTVRRGNFKYVRSFQPFNYDALTNSYRAAMPTYQEMYALNKKGKLNEVQRQFFEAKCPEMLFDLSKDLYETNDLSKDKEYQKILVELRGEMNRWMESNNDMGLLPEFYWIREAGAAAAAYGAQNSDRIKRYLDIANLQLMSYEDAAKGIEKALKSSDPLDRYWGLNVCSSFRYAAREYLPIIKQIAQSDTEATNRVRAAEYMALIFEQTPQKVMCEALYSVSDPMEATLILNSMTLFSEMVGSKRMAKFEIEGAKLNEKIKEHALVKSALAKHTVK